MGSPIRIVQAGIPLLDAVGPEVMDEIREGEVLELHDGALWRDKEKLAVGEILVPDEIEARMEEARRTIGTELQTFAENTGALAFFETLGFRRHGTPAIVQGLRSPAGERLHTQVLVQDLDG